MTAPTRHRAIIYPPRALTGLFWVGRYQRCATFEFCGTPVDWNARVGVEVGRLFGDADGQRLSERYHAIEPRVQQEHQERS